MTLELLDKLIKGLSLFLTYNEYSKITNNMDKYLIYYDKLDADTKQNLYKHLITRCFNKSSLKIQLLEKILNENNNKFIKYSWVITSIIDHDTDVFDLFYKKYPDILKITVDNKTI